jgi:hypothetical protein
MIASTWPGRDSENGPPFHTLEIGDGIAVAIAGPSATATARAFGWVDRSRAWLAQCTTIRGDWIMAELDRAFITFGAGCCVVAERRTMQPILDMEAEA